MRPVPMARGDSICGGRELRACSGSLDHNDWRPPGHLGCFRHMAVQCEATFGRNIADRAWAAARQLSRPESDALSTWLFMALSVARARGCRCGRTPQHRGSNLGRPYHRTQAKVCSVAIMGLSFAPLALLLTAMRAGAPRWPRMAGAMVGLLAGATGALFYAIHCPDDSPLFVAVWYTPP